MIKNKKLLIVTLIVMLVLCLSIDLPILLSGAIRTVGIEMSLFFIGNAILGLVGYTLIYYSLEKTKIIKQVYKFTLFIGFKVLVVGVLLLITSL